MWATFCSTLHKRASGEDQYICLDPRTRNQHSIRLLTMGSLCGLDYKGIFSYYFRLHRDSRKCVLAVAMALIAVYLGIGTVGIGDVLPVKECTIPNG